MADPARCRLHIDEPVPFCAGEGGMQLSGWCFDESSANPAETRVVIAGQVFGCDSGLPRPEVAVAFPQFPQAAHSGFAFRRWMPAGYHEAHFEVRSNGSDWSRVRSLPFCGEIAPLVARVESPVSDAVDEGMVTIAGWAFHPQEPIEELTLQFHGMSARCHYGIARPDVAHEFPTVPHAGPTGFECKIRLRPGTTTLQLRARLRSGAVVVHRNVQQLTVRRDAATDAFLLAIDERRAGLLRFPAAKQPQVSIIIAVYNQLDVTLACLKSILRNTTGVSYEVILINDCSDERTTRSLDSISGLRVLTNTTNQGFLLNCNKGAAEARGEYLLFLNNDTEVTPRWLEGMMRVFAQRPVTGLVGAKLIYPDGTLQEAGGIMWRDASGVNYGKWDSSEKPEYNYLREVDYCSGACILIRKELFDQLGGFDLRYVPAYYEDTDLAFQVRDAGLKVYYQPLAVIVHHEGKSSGRSTESGVKAYQLVNAVKFRTKWRKALATHLKADSKNVPRAKDRGVSKRALVVDARVPCPDQDSGSVRMVNFLTILQELGFQVTFAPGNMQRVSPYTDRLQDLGIECLYNPFFPGIDGFFEERGNDFDIVILSRAEIAQGVLPFCEKHIPGTPVVFDTVDLHFLRGQREAELAQDPEKLKQAEGMREMELGLAARCSAVIVVSSYEKEVLEPLLPERRVAVVSNIHPLHDTAAPFAGRRDFVFIGGFEHPPNTDAMLWFCAEIMPLILAALPDAKLHIIGSKMPETVRSLASDHVVTHGYVEDIEPFFASCLLSVAPLRYGAGVKGKINQSMSHGLPVVSTTMGAEGMHLVHGENILVADEPAEFAAEVVRLCRDEALWNKLSENGKGNIREHFSFAAAKRDLAALLTRLGLLPAASGKKRLASRGKKK